MKKFIFNAILVITLIPGLTPASQVKAQEDTSLANYARFDLQLEARLAVKGELVTVLEDNSQKTTVTIGAGETTIVSQVFPFMEGDWQIDLVTDEEHNILHLCGTLNSVTDGYSAQFTKGGEVDTDFLNFATDKHDLTVIVGYVSGSLATSISLKQSMDCAIQLGLDTNADGTISEAESYDFNVSGIELFAETPFFASIPPSVKYYVKATQGEDIIAEGSGLYDLLNERELAFADGYQFTNRESATVFNIVIRRNPYVASLPLPNRDVLPGPIVAVPEKQGEDTVGITIQTFDSSDSEVGNPQTSSPIQNTDSLSWTESAKTFLTKWWLLIAVVLGILFGLLLFLAMLKKVLR